MAPGRGTIDGVATADEDDIEARFAAIVSPIASTMNWTRETDTDPGQADPDASQVDAAEVQAAEVQAAAAARERDARRERRRLERAQELAEYQAEKAELEAAYNSDDDHFRPPPPPPLPRLRPATVGAVLLLFAGIALVAMPSLLVIDPQLTMVLGLILIAGGAATLLSRLRGHEDDSDNGARL